VDGYVSSPELSADLKQIVGGSCSAKAIGWIMKKGKSVVEEVREMLGVKHGRILSSLPTWDSDVEAFNGRMSFMILRIIGMEGSLSRRLVHLVQL
jgi:hypothetical protein